ncbi:hypothetical protein FKW77_002342 [Venturia effusa]|uniref:Extracellular membrane protein CFEM domain-containing protein n=1 Tax=Venturia effusa TaxID=50376 RepID=A0A517L0X7_9PEZI|nr:hypothetical protein FKW77_002342 [Venturia effusa]
MKLSSVIALSIAALASAQVPKGSGSGQSNSTPKQIPEGIRCAIKCLAPLKEAGCKLDGLMPNKGAGGMPGKPPGGLQKPPPKDDGMGDMPGMNMVRRQTDSPVKAPPKISSEQMQAAKQARECLCAAPAMKTAQTCISSTCASTGDAGGPNAVKGLNAICKGVSSFTPSEAPAAGGAAGGGAAPPS